MTNANSPDRQRHPATALKYSQVADRGRSPIILAGEASGAEAPVRLSEQESAAVRQRMSALQALLQDNKIKAKYKIELFFGKARSLHGHTPGCVSFWESGAKFHGGGDVKIYICPGDSLKKNGCSAILKDFTNTMGTIVCPHCGSQWLGEQVVGEVLASLPMRKWSELLYRYFLQLDQHCDIYLKHAPDDVRTVALPQVARATFRGSQQLDRVRAKRARHVYPLANIIKDVNAGADILRRIHSFLTS